MNIRPSMKKFASGAKMISDLGFRNSDLGGDYRLQAIGYRGQCISGWGDS
jgi:hypothetical protein